jgi:hypothetical protein
MIPMLSRGFTWWGMLLQGIAILHFIRRRPDTYWLYIILIGGWLGALVYIAAELIPDLGLLRGSFQAFPRRKRIRELQALILDNPSAGNYEELAGLFQDEKNYVQARDCYNKAITVRTDSADPFYRRGQCALELGDFAAAVPDLERVVGQDRKYDFQRAAGLLAHAYASTGQPEKADALFREVLVTSTLSETYVNYASCLAAQGRIAEAREIAQKVLARKPAMPAYQKRRERPWFRKAAQILKRLPA